MKVFDPPIEQRETEELIEIANGTTEYWQQDAIELARAELIKRNISGEEQDQVIHRWEEYDHKSEIEYQRQIESNAFERYSATKMLAIFLTSPFIVFKGFTLDYSLSDLKRENYQIKFQQRLAMLILGILFYIGLLWGSYHFFQVQWQNEVNRTDISKWEKNRINDTTNRAIVNKFDSLKK